MGLANFRPSSLIDQPTQDLDALNPYQDYGTHDVGLLDLMPHLCPHEILIFYDATPNSQVADFRIFRSILGIVHRRSLLIDSSLLPCQPFPSERISASDIDAEECVVDFDDGAVRTVVAKHLGLIGISISVIDFDPNPGMPVGYLVA